MEKSSDNIRGLNLKATELRLGLPGSEREDHEVSLKNFVSGAKRGFSDCLDARPNWVFSAGSDGLFSPDSDGAGLKPVQDKKKPSPVADAAHGNGTPPTSKAQVVGWPPIRSFRKNSMAPLPTKTNDDTDTKLGAGCLYVKVSMDGAPYLRKVDLRIYSSYKDLSSALEKMFGCFTIGQCSSHGVHAKDRLSASRLMDLLHGSEYVLTYEDKDGDWMLVGDVPWEMFTNSCKKLRIMKSSEAIGLAPRAMEKCKDID